MRCVEVLLVWVRGSYVFWVPFSAVHAYVDHGVLDGVSYRVWGLAALFLFRCGFLLGVYSSIMGDERCMVILFVA
jgi:hypothetical protein